MFLNRIPTFQENAKTKEYALEVSLGVGRTLAYSAQHKKKARCFHLTRCNLFYIQRKKVYFLFLFISYSAKTNEEMAVEKCPLPPPTPKLYAKCWFSYDAAHLSPFYFIIN